MASLLTLITVLWGTIPKESDSLNTVNGPNSVYCSCQKGHRNEQSLKASVPRALANGEEFSRWYKISHFSSFATNRAIKCWLPKGQSSGGLGVWFLSIFCIFGVFFLLFFHGETASSKKLWCLCKRLDYKPYRRKQSLSKYNRTERSCDK